MSNHITTTGVLSLSAEKVEEFKKLVTEMIKKVQANEPNTLRYDWFLSEDESKCYVIEMYQNQQPYRLIGKTLTKCLDLSLSLLHQQN